MRTAFYISDGTAITSEVFGHALLSLFPVEFNHQTIPFDLISDSWNQCVAWDGNYLWIGDHHGEYIYQVDTV